MLRSPCAKSLKYIFDNPVIHDLSSAPSVELGYIYLLMQIAGKTADPNHRYGFAGHMPFVFPDQLAAINQLRQRGYLADVVPVDYLLAEQKVPALKELLTERGLPIMGLRQDLVTRLAASLTADDVIKLSAKLNIWFPSRLGFEMLYSYYVYWDACQLALINALVSRDTMAITATRDALFSLIPYNPGLNLPYAAQQEIPGFVLNVSDTIEAMIAFSYVCGFAANFYISPPPVNKSELGQAYTQKAFEFSQKYSKERLAKYKSEGIKKVRWSIGKQDGEECELCLSRANKVYLIDTAPQCPAHIGCRCFYAAVVEHPGQNVRVGDSSK